jgi:outer membrane lipoprotein SlyB
MLRQVVFAAACAAVLAGCAASQSGSAYSRAETRQVQIEGTKTPVGTVAGAAVGGIAGSSVGGGKGQAVGAVLGAVGGGLAGAAVEEGVTRKTGLEITVRLDSGRMIAVTQVADEHFAPGQRVRILTGGDGVTRVAR